MKFPFNLLLLIYAITSFLIVSSCEPETIIETEYITVNDTLYVSTTDTLFVSTIDTLLIPDEAAITNFILVRHAETFPIGNNPALVQAGIDRAEKLANMLSELELDRVYSTVYNRTTQTATPTAENQGLDITNYGGFDQEEVIDDVLENATEGKILIVGHSNTTANFLNALTGTLDYPSLSGDAYDNIFIVNTKSKGDSEVIHLKY